MFMSFRFARFIFACALLTAFSIGWHQIVSAEAKDSVGTQALLDLQGRTFNPFENDGTNLTVFIFVRTDCPISNKYAPEVRRLTRDFSSKNVRFWLVYPNGDELPAEIQKHLKEYDYGSKALRDPEHWLVKRSGATITPEAAVFRGKHLVYHGRIDNKFADLGRARPEATTHELRDVLETLLSGKTPAISSAPAVGCAISDLK
jgi:hypothetical protein